MRVPNVGRSENDRGKCEGEKEYFERLKVFVQLRDAIFSQLPSHSDYHLLRLPADKEIQSEISADDNEMDTVPENVVKNDVGKRNIALRDPLPLIDVDIKDQLNRNEEDNDEGKDKECPLLLLSYTKGIPERHDDESETSLIDQNSNEDWKEQVMSPVNRDAPKCDRPPKHFREVNIVRLEASYADQSDGRNHEPV